MDRIKYLGATDIPAILGLSPWRTSWEVWAEKTGRLEPRETSPAIEAGLVLESSILDWAEKRLGPLQRQPTFVIDGTPIVCHPDAVTQASEPVEAKTSGITGPVHGEWGPDGSDDIPPMYLVQVLVQLAATQADQAYLVALIGGLGFRTYTIEHKRDLSSQLVEFACEWWDRHVVKDTPPLCEQPPSVSVLSRLKRQPNKVIQLEDTGLVEEWLKAKQAVAEAQKAEDEARAKLLLALGDAEAAELPDGRRITYLEYHRKGYTVQATSYRSLKIEKSRR